MAKQVVFTHFALIECRKKALTILADRNQFPPGSRLNGAWNLGITPDEIMVVFFVNSPDVKESDPPRTIILSCPVDENNSEELAADPAVSG